MASGLRIPGWNHHGEGGWLYSYVVAVKIRNEEESKRSIKNIVSANVDINPGFEKK